MQNSIISLTDQGIYCPAGDFYIDPWKPVSRAIITHAHSDHARWGSAHYLTSSPGKLLLQTRLGPEANIEAIDYGESIYINGVELSLHPAGHILGSSQVRLCYQGKIWVISGDYKLEPDSTCANFETVPCHAFVSEATFGLPIYQWQLQQTVFDEINTWWLNNQNQGITSILLGYALGKSQRLLSGLNAEIGPIYTHGAVEKLTEIYRQSGIRLPDTAKVTEQDKNTHWHTGIVIAPPSALGTAWAKRFGKYATAFTSGWMIVRGARRRRNVDQGFVLSDHADWPSLLQAIYASQAEEIYITHGNSAPLVRYLKEQGFYAEALTTLFGQASAEEDES